MTRYKSQPIAVLAGGFSEERAVSFRSGTNVANALVSLGYDAQVVDPVDTLDFSGFGAAFNVLHGHFGEDGNVQALLEDQKIPYTGSGVESSLVCLNKVTSKHLFNRHGIPTSQFSIHVSALRSLPEGYAFPVVLKPLSEGSSVGVFIIDTDAELTQHSTHLVDRYVTYMLEDYVPGTEVTVGVIQTPETIALPVLELRSKNRFYDYEAKYTPGMTTFVVPAEVSDFLTRQVQEIAVATFELLKCSGLGRVDFILDPEKGPFVLEVNTVPGMTDTSDLPAQAKAAGMSFETLVETVLNQASLKH